MQNLLREGRTQKDIAEALNVSIGIVRTYGITSNAVPKHDNDTEDKKLVYARIYAAAGDSVEGVVAKTGLSRAKVLKYVFNAKHRKLVPADERQTSVHQPPLVKGTPARSHVNLAHVMSRYPLESERDFVVMEEYLASVAARMLAESDELTYRQVNSHKLQTWLDKGVPYKNRRAIAKAIGWDIAALCFRAPPKAQTDRIMRPN